MNLETDDPIEDRLFFRWKTYPTKGPKRITY